MSPATKIAVVLLGAATLAWAAMWNGYPFLSSDTGAYLANAFEGGVESRRPSLYPLLIGLISAKASLWPVVALQSVMVAAAMWSVAWRLGGGSRAPAVYAAGILVGAAATALPWFAGRVMPDIFTGVLGIAAYILVFAERRPAGWERTAWLVISAVSVACHIGNLPVLVCGLALGLAAWAVAGKPLRPLLPTATLLTGLAATCAAGVVGLNWAHNGTPTLSTESHTFTMVRLVRYGVVQRLLDEHCADTAYALCPYRAELSAAPNHYAFSPASPLHKIGGPVESRTVSEKMIADANRHYPGMQAQAAVGAVTEQFAMVWLGMGLGPHRGQEGPAAVLARHLPHEHPQFAASRQHQAALAVDRFNLVITPVTWGAMAVAAMMTVVALRRRGRWASGNLVTFALLWVSANAAVIGVLATPFDRYQARVAWLLPVIIAMVLVAERGSAPEAAAKT